MKRFLFISVSILIVLAGCTVPKKYSDIREYTKDLQTVLSLFPRSVRQIEKLKWDAIKRARKEVNEILAIGDEERTFDNTFGGYDRVYSHFKIASSRISILRHVSPDEKIREASEKATIAMSEIAIDLFNHNVALYSALKSYVQNNAKKEQLTSTQKYFIEETLNAFKRAGLTLPEDKRNHVKALKKELSVLSIEFSKNIINDTSFIAVEKDELQGLDDDFIEALQKTDEGKYKVGLDQPTFFSIMEFCSVASTRKKLFEMFVNLAYPQNKNVLEQIVEKCDELAQLLGYASYADLSLDDTMAKSPERAKKLINTLLPKAQEKERQEFALLTKDLPPSVTLTADGKMEPWNGAFVSVYYKKKHYNLDERLIAEYFPMETTIQGLLYIYTSFFDLEMKQEPISELVHEDILLIKIYRKSDSTLLGYFFLDLHPRTNKYGHACQITVVPATKNKDGTSNPAVVVVLANFPKSTENKPSLLKRIDVSTFFHEFGHAIHTILGATEIISFSGTNVKADFVEMPSQMLEYWLLDRDILKMISRHYKTGEPLPDDIIDTIIDLKNFRAGAYVTHQLFFAQLSLQMYGPGSEKNLDALLRQVWEQTLLFTDLDNNDHSYASIGHLTGYGARYYGYMWSKVFAADLFYYIKPHGLMNPDIGTLYAEKILAPGGSVDPNELLKDFLNREPNEKAFLEDLGL